MADSSFGKLIRTGETEILSATIKTFDPKTNTIRWRFEPFREAVQKKCGILFYEYEGQFYYPLSMEFRLIDNNALFLIEELGINSFRDIKLVLQSSFKREEGREVDFFALIYKVKTAPRFCRALKNFIFEDEEEVVYAK